MGDITPNRLPTTRQLRYNSLWTIGCCLLLAASAQAQPVLVEVFSSGDRFYLDTRSIRPADRAGHLRYTIYRDPTGHPNQPPAEHSDNLVDCAAGTYQARLSVSQDGTTGNDTPVRRLPANPIALRNPNAPLYSVLKEACQTHAPQHVGDW